MVVVTAQQQPHPNNKTTKTVVVLRLSNRWENPPLTPPTRNEKLHDRAEIEQHSEKKLLVYMWRPQNSF